MHPTELPVHTTDPEIHGQSDASAFAAGSAPSHRPCQLEWLPRCPDFLGALCALGYQPPSQRQPDEQELLPVQPCSDLAALHNLQALVHVLPLALKAQVLPSCPPALLRIWVLMYLESSMHRGAASKLPALPSSGPLQRHCSCPLAWLCGNPEAEAMLTSPCTPEGLVWPVWPQAPRHEVEC